jgi:hypothetical protein
VQSCVVKIQDEGHFWIKGSSGIPEQLSDHEAQCCRCVMETRQPLLISEAWEPASHACAYAGHPLYIERQLVGVLCLTDIRPRPDFQETAFGIDLGRFAALTSSVLTAAYLKMRAAARPDIFRHSPLACWSGVQARSCG